MKAAELKEKGVSELRDDLLKLRKDQFNLRMQNASGQLGQPHLLKEAKKDIARVKTVLREKLENE